MFKLIVLVPCVLCLGGCWWGAIFGGDQIVKVKNNADSKIKVTPVGDFLGDDMYNGQRRDVAPSESEYFHFDGFESDPKIDVRYKDQKRIYETHIDFFGYDEIKVEAYHFVNANG